MSNQLDFQQRVLIELGDIKVLCATNAANNRAVDTRVTSLEKTNERQWWLHGAQALLISAIGIMRRGGVL